MTTLHDVAAGWQAYAAAGLLAATVGLTVVAALAAAVPGLAPAAVMAMLLPFAMRRDALTAAVWLLAAYSGAHFGAAMRSILAAGPGWTEPVDVDGQQRARQGRATSAIAAAALASLVGGVAAIAVAAVAARPLHALADDLGPADTFGFGVLVLAGGVALGAGPLLKGLGMAVCGVLLSITGVLNGWLGGGSGASGSVVGSGASVASAAAVGHQFAVLAMGLYGFGALIDRAMADTNAAAGRLHREPWPTRTEWRAGAEGAARGAGIGLLLGLLPGGGARLGTWVAHRVERRRPAADVGDSLGKGNLRGVCAPQAARQAGAHVALVPLAVLGLPLNAALALLVGATAMRAMPADLWSSAAAPAIWWTGLTALAWAHAAVLLLALPMAVLTVQLLSVPRPAVIGVLTVVGCIGIHGLRGHVDDVLAAAVLAVVGHGLRLLGCSVGPLLVGYVLAPTMDDALRRALQVAAGDWGRALAQPIAVLTIGTALLLLLLSAAPPIAARRRAALRTSRTLPTDAA